MSKFTDNRCRRLISGEDTSCSSCHQEMNKLHLLITNTNWDLLRQQKMTLLRMVGTRGALPLNGEQLQLLNGLMNFLDDLQDWAVDVYVLSQKQVFGYFESIEDCEICLDSTCETCSTID